MRKYDELRKPYRVLAGFGMVGGALVILLGGILLYGLAMRFVADEFIVDVKGPLVDENALPEPLWPQRESVPLYAAPGGKIIGVLDRGALYPVDRPGDWTVGVIYFWGWNQAYTPGLGGATVTAASTDLHATADGIATGTINTGAPVEKVYLNDKGSWALCTARVAVRSADVGPAEHDFGNWLTDKHAVLTWTDKRYGEVGTQESVKSLYDNGWLIVLAPLVFAYGATAYARRRRTVTKNRITVSDVRHSAVTIQSPLASAIVGLDDRGDPETAQALLELATLVEGSELESADKRDLVDLVQGLAEEAKRPEPRKVRMKALGEQLSIGIASSLIADQGAPLMHVISKLWQG